MQTWNTVKVFKNFAIAAPQNLFSQAYKYRHLWLTWTTTSHPIRSVTKIQFQNEKALTELRHRYICLTVHQKLPRLHCTQGDDPLRQKFDGLRSGTILCHRILLQPGEHRKCRLPTIHQTLIICLFRDM